MEMRGKDIHVDHPRDPVLRAGREVDTENNPKLPTHELLPWSFKMSLLSCSLSQAVDSHINADADSQKVDDYSKWAEGQPA